MAGEPDLVGLLYRADWTRLSLSAEVNDGSTVLIAPGRRYRLQAGITSRDAMAAVPGSLPLTPRRIVRA
jgi:hypothetical protein